ncbi:glycosyltransferase family 33 protein [Sphaerobolus stellatus SS14]|nr:glycosyltransferase family 33 protein [Sphaerobolus stellatus SS14]
MPLDATDLALAATAAAILLVAAILHVRSDSSPLRRSAAVVGLGEADRSPRITLSDDSLAIPRVRFVYQLHLQAAPVPLPPGPNKGHISIDHDLLCPVLQYEGAAPILSCPEPTKRTYPSTALAIPSWLLSSGTSISLSALLKAILWEVCVCACLRHPGHERQFGQGIESTREVLHDRPPAHFHSCLPEVHDLFLRLSSSLDPTLGSFFPSHKLPESTAFTTLAPAATSTSIYFSSPLHNRRPDRPALIVSSTASGNLANAI